MSVGGFPYSQAVQDAVTYAWNKGAVLVGAAGNNNRAETFYPASFDHVVSVSATQVEDEFSNWSSYGPNVDVSAPGLVGPHHQLHGDVCRAPGLGRRTPTSAAPASRRPNVAGVVALIRAKYPSYTPPQVVSRLRQHRRRPRLRGLGRPLRARPGQRATARSVASVAGRRRGRRRRPRAEQHARAAAARSPLGRTPRAVDLSGRRRGRVRRRGAACRPPRRSRDRRRRHARLAVAPERPARRPDRRAVRHVRTRCSRASTTSGRPASSSPRSPSAGRTRVSCACSTTTPTATASPTR